MIKSKVIFIASFLLFFAVSAFAQRPSSKISAVFGDITQKSFAKIDSIRNDRNDLTYEDLGLSVNPKKDSIHNGHTYVDLGLSVKWATCNVGTYNPEYPGMHYAWGETTPKVSYNESNSKTAGVNMGDISGNPNYDVARATWGGTWRLPTIEEFKELIQCCTWTWTTLKGTKGYKVTSRRNGNSIFLPAAGEHKDSSLNYAGSEGIYWSSSPYNSHRYLASVILFSSSECDTGWGSRYFGFSVRAVCE